MAGSKHPIFIGVVVSLTILIVAVTYWGIVTLESAERDIAPVGDISVVVPVSSKEIWLGIGEVSEPIDYDECRIVLVSPNSWETYTIDLDGRYTGYSAPENSFGLTTIGIVDQTENGMIDAGDMITIIHEYDLSEGTWDFKLLYGSNSISMHEVFVVPDMEDAPYGSFHSTNVLSASKVIVSFGLISTDVPFYYTKLVLTSPDGNGTMEWSLGMDVSQPHVCNGTVSVYISDADRENIIDYLDRIIIQSTGNGLAKGTWGISLVYDFTDEVICQTSFEIEG